MTMLLTPGAGDYDSTQPLGDPPEPEWPDIKSPTQEKLDYPEGLFAYPGYGQTPELVSGTMRRYLFRCARCQMVSLHDPAQSTRADRDRILPAGYEHELYWRLLQVRESDDQRAKAWLPYEHCLKCSLIRGGRAEVEALYDRHTGYCVGYRFAWRGVEAPYDAMVEIVRVGMGFSQQERHLRLVRERVVRYPRAMAQLRWLRALATQPFIIQSWREYTPEDLTTLTVRDQPGLGRLGQWIWEGGSYFTYAPCFGAKGEGYREEDEAAWRQERKREAVARTINGEPLHIVGLDHPEPRYAGGHTGAWLHFATSRQVDAPVPADPPPPRLYLGLWRELGSKLLEQLDQRQAATYRWWYQHEEYHGGGYPFPDVVMQTEP